MGCWHVPIWSSAVYRWLAGRDIDGVGEVGRNELPCDVRHHESEGTHEVVGGAQVPSMCFHIFGPGFQVVTRVINEGGGDVESRGGHFQRVRMDDSDECVDVEVLIATVDTVYMYYEGCD